MIIKFYPNSNTAYIPSGFKKKQYDLSDGSLSDEMDQFTGYYSAEAFLNDLEFLLGDINFDLIIIKKVKE